MSTKKSKNYVNVRKSNNYYNSNSKNYSKQQRKPQNLNGLYAVPIEFAKKDDGTFRQGTFGVVTKNDPFVAKQSIIKGTKDFKRSALVNSTDLPNTVKNRMLAFYDDKANKQRNVAVLVEKKLYDEYISKKDKK